MLTERQRDQLLIRLDERVDQIRTDQKDLKAAMESDEGFTRCQLHGQKMDSIEQSLRWTKREVWAAVVTIMGKIVYE